MRVALTGGGAKDAGHSHHDRGSLIVEVFGEQRYHCIACPGPMDALPRQAAPVPTKVVPVGTGDDVRLETGIDVSAAWDPVARSARRRLESPQPEELTVIDSFELSAGTPITGIFNTIGSIEQTADGWRVRVGGFVADILPAWRPARARVTDNMHDAAGQPCRALMKKSAPARAHRLATRIVLSRA